MLRHFGLYNVVLTGRLWFDSGLWLFSHHAANHCAPALGKPARSIAPKLELTAGQKSDSPM